MLLTSISFSSALLFLKMLLNILSKVFLNMSVKTSRNGLVVAKKILQLIGITAKEHQGPEARQVIGTMGNRHQFIISDSQISDGRTDGWTKKSQRLQAMTMKHKEFTTCSSKSSLPAPTTSGSLEKLKVFLSPATEYSMAQPRIKLSILNLNFCREVPGPRLECSHLTVRDVVVEDSKVREVGGFAIVTNVKLVSSDMVLKRREIFYCHNLYSPT